MAPYVELVGLKISTYALFVILGFALSISLRRRAQRRLGYVADPRHRYVIFGALVGAIVGAKVGMLLFVPLEDFARLLTEISIGDFTGKTVIGGLIGGYIGVELTKKLVGIRYSTGDAFALALPVGLAAGRLGCFFNGCCYGTETHLPWAVHTAGALRHPTQLYESALLAVLAALVWRWESRQLPPGHLFRWFLVGYGLIRFGTEFVRGDAGLEFGPLTAVQLVCLATIVGFLPRLFVRGTAAPQP